MFTFLMSLLINGDDSTQRIVAALCFAQQCRLICFSAYLFIKP